MISAEHINPPIQIARRQPYGTLVNLANAGMVELLNGWRGMSQRFGAHRKLDGLGPIDTAVDALRLAWPSTQLLPAGVEAMTETLLVACAGWQRSRREGCLPITGWREAAIAQLYWKVAWCYVCATYSRLASAKITQMVGTVAGTVTLATPTDIYPDCYDPCLFPGSGLRRYTKAPGTRLFRGDSRAPWIIAEAGGFKPRNYANADADRFRPWFHGHNMETPSTSTDLKVAINAAKGAQSQELAPEGRIPRWMMQFVRRSNSGPNAREIYSCTFVYELGEMPTATVGASVSTDVTGEEVVFLAIPDAVISRWWIIQHDDSTIGPFSFAETQRLFRFAEGREELSLDALTAPANHLNGVNYEAVDNLAARGLREFPGVHPIRLPRSSAAPELTELDRDWAKPE
ncbi:hypothetical protein [Rugamonas aquatica]|uniref:Uncharacterized protein n=1 Tax=Rugamonas aquatica TaxID=2743357 RepID=A0A6A7NBK5_9BURK|nr:hypothetical protein [Rugamonas aquatica]MQA42560.1 hypothetical protein [Rugamonas aquatica]